MIKNKNAALTRRTVISFDKWVTIEITATNTMTKKENNKAAKKEKETREKRKLRRRLNELYN